MPRLLFAVIAILIALAASACGGGGGSASPTPEASPTAEPTATPSQPASTQTPEATGTPASTPQAIAPPDSIEEFLAQYEEEQIVQKACELDFEAGVVDCGDNGLYAPSPLPSDAEAQCAVLLVESEPIAVACQSQLPLTVIYYAVTS